MEQKSRIVSPVVWQLFSFALVFALWEVAGRWPISFAFPPFSKTFMALLRMIADGSLPKAYVSTLQSLVIGIVLCSIAGIGFGIGMGLSRSVERFSLPIFIVLQAAPMAAIIPLLTYMYGIGLTSKVLAVVILAAPVIVMNSYKGIRNINPSLIQMCRAFLGTRRQEVIKMSVGVKNLRHSQSELTNFTKDPIRRAAGVHHYRLFAHRIADDGAITTERRHRQRFTDHS